MAAYNYKYVRALLPPFAEVDIEDYEGTSNYDGDMWLAAANYITALETELGKQYAITKQFSNDRLLDWLKTRPKSIYSPGPVIVDEIQDAS